MKRRSFFQVVAATSLAPAAAQNGPASAPDAAPQPLAIEATAADAAAEPRPAFFTAAQLRTLHRLCEVIMPASIDAGVPLFLDFLIGASPAPVRQLYRDGLDTLEQRATGKDSNSFDALLAPLRQPWTYDPPAEPFARFLRRAKQDIRTATLNSREYVSQAARRRRAASGVGQYWYPLD